MPLPDDVITPTVKPHESIASVSAEDIAAEKKRKIDEALARFDGKPPESAAPKTQGPKKHAATKPESKPKQPKSPGAEVDVVDKLRAAPKEVREAVLKPVEKSAGQLEALVLGHKVDPTEEKGAETIATIAPTSVDADASIAVQAEALRKKQERETAEAAELAAAEARKYHPPETLGIIAEHKTKFIRYLALWLASAPLSIGMYLGLDKVFHSDIPVYINVPAMIIIFVLALYGLLGWIPLMVLYIRKASI